MAVDALLGRSHLDDGVDVEFLLLVDQAVDFDFPGAGAEFLGELGGTVFVGREFVVVVVGGDVFVGSDRFGGAERALLDAVDFVSRERHRGRRDEFAQACAGGGCGSGERCAGQKLAAVQIQSAGSDFRETNIWPS
jgi:hypothetical protein